MCTVGGRTSSHGTSKAGALPGLKQLTEWVYVSEHRQPSIQDCGAKIVGTLGDGGNNSEKGGKKEDLRKACVMEVPTINKNLFVSWWG